MPGREHDGRLRAALRASAQSGEETIAMLDSPGRRIGGTPGEEVSSPGG